MDFRTSIFYKKIHPWIVKLKAAYNFYLSKHTDYFQVTKLSMIRCRFIGKDYSAKHGNFCFGNERVIKNHFSTFFHEDSMIEHGVYFNEGIIYEEVEDKDVNYIYTYSDYRKQVLINHYGQDFNKEIFVIGPYIQYASNFKSTMALTKLKQALGKTLLVFPAHGYPGFDIRYDEDLFLNAINQVAINYNTVLISLNGYDISHGRSDRYLKCGYKIVSSGNRLDQFFLNRQRDLIELSDMTMSNSLGTHIGYCICLGRPHYVFNQPMTFLNSDGSMNMVEHGEKMNRERTEIFSIFCSTEPRITQEQYGVVHKYWGPFLEI